MTFDVAAQRATVEASVDFVVQGFDGCPVLDLRQPIDSILLDGKTLPGEAFPHHDLGGGPGAEMRVLDATLAAGSRHRLDLGYQLATPDATGAEPIAWGDGVRFDLWMSDLFPGRYLEMWLPANLCHDRFALGLDIAVVGAPVGHAVVSNGAQRTVGPGRWRVDYPDRFTSLSPLLVLAPAHDLQVSHRQVAVAGRPTPLGLVTARLPEAEAEADLAACEADLAAWLTYNAERFGPWVHGDRFTAVIWASDRGMEYDGATTAMRRRAGTRGVPQLVRPGHQAGPGQRRLDRRGLDRLVNLNRTATVSNPRNWDLTNPPCCSTRPARGAATPQGSPTAKAPP